MKTYFDRKKSLQELEDDDWGDAHETALVERCHQLRRKPLQDFTVGDLRVMIGQDISLYFLVPLALEQLENDSLLEASFYPGDLLGALLRAKPGFWRERPDLRREVERILSLAEPLPEEVSEALVEFNQVGEGR